MADRDVTKPGDTDVISAYPANERAQRVAQGAIFDVDHFNPDDADQGKHRLARLKSLGADPGGVANFGVVYTKVFDGRVELFWQDNESNVVRLTSKGESNIDLGTSNLVASSMTAGYYRGDVIALGSVANAVSLDWTAGQYSTLTNPETVTISFSNEPLIGEGIGQTIMIAIQDAGNFAITLDPTSGFTINVRAIDSPLAFTTDGLDIFILTVYASGIITVIPLYDFGPL